MSAVFLQSSFSNSASNLTTTVPEQRRTSSHLQCVLKGKIALERLVSMLFWVASLGKRVHVVTDLLLNAVFGVQSTS